MILPEIVSVAFLKQLWLTLGASLSFLIIGLVRGYSSSAIPSIEFHDADLLGDTSQKSWFGAIPPVGAFTGSLCSGYLMQRIGRRRTLQITAPIWTGSWLLLAFAPSFPFLLLGRILSGLCVGFSIAPTQVYVSECCDPGTRGRLGSLPTLSMSFGILLSYIAGNWLYWRHLAFFSAAFCVLLFLALLPLPESPVWLKEKGINEEYSIEWLHLSPISTAAAKEENNVKAPIQAEPESLFQRKIFFSPVVIKPLIIVFSLLFFQQFSGIDSVIFFTVEIFSKAGSTLDPMTATIIVGLVQLVFNGISTLLVDKAGRKPLLLISAAVMTIAMAAMGTAYYFEFESKSNKLIGYLPVVSLVIFILGFSLGFGGIPFLLLGEMFPAHYRSQLSSMAGAVNLLTMFTVIKTYHYLDHAITSAGTFWMYTGFCMVAFIFVIFIVPETKGKSLADIEQHFRSNDKKEKVELATISTKF